MSLLNLHVHLPFRDDLFLYMRAVSLWFQLYTNFKYLNTIANLDHDSPICYLLQLEYDANLALRGIIKFCYCQQSSIIKLI